MRLDPPPNTKRGYHRKPRRKRSRDEWRKEVLRRFVFPGLFLWNRGFRVLDERWDNLIILDACRYDVFREGIGATGIRGRLSWRTSRGTDTGSFIRENFSGSRFLEDVVYVTANPTVSREMTGRVSKMVPVWRGGWDKGVGTVPPEATYRAAVDAIDRYRGRRFIIHFLQPHAPFFGHRHFSGLKKTRPPPRLLVYTRRDTSHWPAIPKDTLLWLQGENLRLVLPFVERLVNVLPGRTVITSDHGEAMGEKLHPLVPVRVYQHPEDARIPALVRVPWFVIDSPKKREPAVGGGPEGTETLSKEEEALIQEKLVALGYQ